MSPKVADPETRARLLDEAARLLAERGPAALTTRRLADWVGSSTMAIYTHFGDMDGLRRAVRLEGFRRLAAHLDSVQQTRDPVADQAALGWAYCVNALANPHLYRAIFLEAPVADDDAEIGVATFQPIVTTAHRCIDAGRFNEADPWSLAVQLWTSAHGMVTAVLAGLLDLEAMVTQFSLMGENLFVGLGDDRVAAKRSIQRARRRMERSTSSTLE